jgi:dipeptidyl aminopeptidase/acylaminoacyl peptidase
MNKDLRGSPLYRQAEMLFDQIRRPASGLITDAYEICVAPDRACAVFVGEAVEGLECLPSRRIWEIDLHSGSLRALTFGPQTDRLPKFSPDGSKIAFLSDRRERGNFQLWILDLRHGAVRRTPEAEGWVENFHWSPDGRKLLLCTAGHGADIAGSQGAIASKRRSSDSPSWLPSVDTSVERYSWRQLLIYQLDNDGVVRVKHKGLNPWEATWVGNTAIAMIASDKPGEGSWYSSRLILVDLEQRRICDLFQPEEQIALPVGSPDGTRVSVIESICSDRGISAGDLRVIDVRSRDVEEIQSNSVDIAVTDWRSDHQIVVAGHRGFETVIGCYDTDTKSFSEHWSSDAITTGGRYVNISVQRKSGDCVFVTESFTRSPEISVMVDGKYACVRSLDAGYSQIADNAIGQVSKVEWEVFDGLVIHGWLIEPRAERPLPVVMNLHGGPVWHWRPGWLGRTRNIYMLMLICNGYAVFLPNPRGSGGRGQEFARKVIGDINGADGRDLLSGLDYLVSEGIADPLRIGVMGGSYGGNMAAWLITQDLRFRAAVPMFPHCNQVTQHLLSNIPEFMSLFLDDHFSNIRGRYLERSPVMYADQVKTPTMCICGALDRCTPPHEAMQFYRALIERDVDSALVTYPEEGHGIQGFPAALDLAARVALWFNEHMSGKVAVLELQQQLG